MYKRIGKYKKDFSEIGVHISQLNGLYEIVNIIEEINTTEQINGNEGVFSFNSESGVNICNPFLSECGMNDVNPIKYYGDNFIKSIFVELAKSIAISKNNNESEILFNSIKALRKYNNEFELLIF